MTNPGSGFSGGVGQEPSSDEKLLGGFAYVGTVIFCIPTLAIFMMKKDESAYIKFHCLQALGFFLAALVTSIIFGVLGGVAGSVPGLGFLAVMGIGLLNLVVSLGVLVYWVFLMVKAFMGQTVEIPVLGDAIRSNFMN